MSFGRGFSKCLICDDDSGQLLFGCELVINGIITCFKTDAYNIMMQSTHICLDCIGRLQQLFEFNATRNYGQRPDMSEFDESKKCCEFCYQIFSDCEIVPLDMCGAVMEAINLSGWRNDFTNFSEISCCFACYNFLILFSDIEKLLRNLRIQFYAAMRNCKVVLKDIRKCESYPVTVKQERPQACDDDTEAFDSNDENIYPDTSEVTDFIAENILCSTLALQVSETDKAPKTPISVPFQTTTRRSSKISSDTDPGYATEANCIVPLKDDNSASPKKLIRARSKSLSNRKNLQDINDNHINQQEISARNETQRKCLTRSGSMLQLNTSKEPLTLSELTEKFHLKDLIVVVERLDTRPSDKRSTTEEVQELEVKTKRMKISDDEKPKTSSNHRHRRSKSSKRSKPSRNRTLPLDISIEDLPDTLEVTESYVSLSCDGSDKFHDSVPEQETMQQMKRVSPLQTRNTQKELSSHRRSRMKY